MTNEATAVSKIAEITDLLGPIVEPEQRQALAKVLLQRARETVRNEFEVSKQEINQMRHWFVLRLVMGYSAITLLGVVMVVATYIILNSATYPQFVVQGALAALFVDIVGLLISVWRIVLKGD